MPSEKTSKSHYSSQQLFLALILISLVLWILYRSLFDFPVIFDETLGKALFFGLPIWIYLSSTNQTETIKSLSLSKLKTGLLKGLVIGGLFGFVGVLLSLLIKSTPVVQVTLFGSNQFWWEFLLALLTAFWESIFFFGFIQTALNNEYDQLESYQVVLLSALIFLVFHVPNSVLRYQGAMVGQQIWLMSLFALGQSVLFYSLGNTYSLILTHAIWGMVLLIHF
jgi:hypothetical protein